ncbi:MAG: hypothetical protein AAFN74_13885, partial [Myxococcota bacterium]
HVSLHWNEVAIRPGDALQVELVLERPMWLTIGFLGDDGAWLALDERLFLKGRHPVGRHALHVDDAPSGGWFIAGTTEAVAETRRRGRPGSTVHSRRIRVEDAP